MFTFATTFLRPNARQSTPTGSVARGRRRHGQGAVQRQCQPGAVRAGFGHGFTIDFRDAAARDAYLAHNAHQRAGARLVATLEGGTDGLMVIDLEVTQM
ncbi:Dabb family protein [Mesorhizobium sp. CA4]|uniref:Dabb family protein n=1 Tax=Mesorhizobium sp. CA4 TaxID=588499 RepID=UPI001CD0A1ED|nr:Dabb family protein [Mesorhizobium sp. CA4]MBZ9821883.1 Dabb family protein [Mesorhizobium sp. CA4]